MFVCFHCDMGECTCGVSSWGIHEEKPPILQRRFRDDLSDDAFNHEMRDDTFPYPPKNGPKLGQMRVLLGRMFGRGSAGV